MDKIEVVEYFKLNNQQFGFKNMANSIIYYAFIDSSNELICYLIENRIFPKIVKVLRILIPPTVGTSIIMYSFSAE